MKTIEAVRYKQRLDNLFECGSKFSDDIEMLSHWAKYLCIMVSGFIETAVRATYTAYARKKAAPYVANYACAKLGKLSNPKMQDICELTRSFNETWGNRLEKATDGDIKDAVDSIVANRNQIAHGRDVGMSFARVKKYYGSVVKMVEIVEATLSEEP